MYAEHEHEVRGGINHYQQKRELVHHVSTSFYRDQLAFFQKQAEQEDTAMAEIIRRIIDHGINAQEEDADFAVAKNVLEQLYAAATDQETRDAICLLEDKLVNREVEL